MKLVLHTATDAHLAKIYSVLLTTVRVMHYVI